MKILWPRPGQTPGLALLVVVGFAAVSLMLTLPAIALPTLSHFGGQLYYSGGDVTIAVLHTDSKYTDVLQLWSGTTAIDVASGSQVGSRITLTAKQLAEMGIGIGDELQFGIHVLDTSKSFLLGPGSRNADGVDHAYVSARPSGVYVGWEDLFGGGDHDYNDSIFRFAGVSISSQRFAPTATVTPEPAVPEPASLLLLLTGVGLLALTYRKR